MKKLNPMGWLFFAKESIKNMKTSATITPSSKYVCKKMISHVDFQHADVVVELGAGDGVITKYILQEMRPGSKLIVFEILDQFCKKLRQIDDPRLVVIQDSAENMGKHLKEHGYDYAHDVVSAVPFVMLPKELSKRILAEVKQYIRPGGSMVQLHYSTLAKNLYKEIFGKVEVEFVARNIPPAFLHVCRG
jgi:phospholipid N-methyltransferase